MVADKSGIATRYSVLPDFRILDSSDAFFTVDRPQPGVTERMKIFRKEAPKLALKAIEKLKDLESKKQEITHIITTTCTGMYNPGLEIELIQQLGLSSRVHRLPMNFMGCNAAILALNSAYNICKANPKAKVLVVCVELCSLHFQNNFSDDYLLSSALFADGCAALLVEGEGQGLQMNAFASKILENAQSEMAWNITELGFVMNLSSYVSTLLNGAIPALLQDLRINKNDVDHWAIHPGGKKILDEFALALEMEQGKLEKSYQVLRNYGNMSSSTILFVLKKIFDDQQLEANQSVFCAAFGPGLSIESIMLQYV